MSLSQSKSSSKALLEKLQKQVSDLKQTNNSNTKDDRFWTPTVDASGVGSAVLRFLPAKSDDETPFAKVYRHAFQEGNSWFIEPCPTTIGQECPVCQANTVLWKTGLESNKTIVSRRKRRVDFVVNVLVVKDPGNRDNEGQVRLFRFGTKIWEKVEECLSPDEDSGEEAINPFGFYDGANFNLKIANVAGYRNYDKSKFVKAADIENGDEILEKVNSLAEFTDVKNFKAFDEMQQRFNKVIGNVTPSRGTTSMADDDDEEFESVPTKPIKEVGKVDKSKQESNTSSIDIDEDMKFLQDLAGETDPF